MLGLALSLLLMLSVFPPLAVCMSTGGERGLNVRVWLLV